MRKVHCGKFIVLIGILFSLFSGCAGRGVKEDPNALYYRLGARKVLGDLVTDTVDYWTGDKRIVTTNTAIKEKMEKTDLNAMKRGLFSFICWASKGPCTFRSEDLNEAVKGLNITQVEWFYMLEGIMITLQKHQIPIREQNEVLEIVYSLQSKLIGH